MLFTGQKAASHPAESAAETDALDAVRQENGTLRDAIAQLESQNDDLSAQLFDATRAAPVSENPVEADTIDAAIDVAPEDATKDRKLNRDRRWGPKRTDHSDESLAQFGEFFDNLIQSKIDQTQDPAAIERLQALAEWRAYRDDLWRQMREVEDPDQRAVLSEQMRESRDASKEILEQEQARMIAEIAKRNNVQDTDAFTDQIREMLKEPLFDMEGLFVGRGGPPDLLLDFRRRGQEDRPLGPRLSIPPPQ
jgi:cell division protein FtsL